jgi:hypothetical protein
MHGEYKVKYTKMHSSAVRVTGCKQNTDGESQKTYGVFFFSFSTNECTFYFRNFLYTTPYMCFGRNSDIIRGTLLSTVLIILITTVLITLTIPTDTHYVAPYNHKL